MSAPKEQLNIGLNQTIVFLLIAGLLLLTNTFSFNKQIYNVFDDIFNPFLISTRKTANNIDAFFYELTHKKEVINQNIDLKRQILTLQETQAENASLKAQLALLQAQTNISSPSPLPLLQVNIIGIQDIFSRNPQLTIQAGEKQKLKKKDPVYYNKNTLFGFVSEVYPNTSEILPFYSDEIIETIKIPIQNSKDPNQKTFAGTIANGVMVLQKVPKNYQIIEGDIWITGNEVSEVPAGLIIGITKKVTPSPSDGFQEIELEIPFKGSTTEYIYIENRN